jgi:uroporphyrinogen decarboxylase
LPQIAESNCNVVGLGWTMPPETARAQLGKDLVLQGNLDPCVLYADMPEVKKHTIKKLKNPLLVPKCSSIWLMDKY